jgi:hypothetical protein
MPPRRSAGIPPGTPGAASGSAPIWSGASVSASFASGARTSARRSAGSAPDSTRSARGNHRAREVLLSVARAREHCAEPVAGCRSIWIGRRQPDHALDRGSLAPLELGGEEFTRAQGNFASKLGIAAHLGGDRADCGREGRALGARMQRAEERLRPRARDVADRLRER